MKILVCGCNGQLGSDCINVFRDDNDVTGVDLPDFDITDSELVNKTIQNLKPEVIRSQVNGWYN